MPKISLPKSLYIILIAMFAVSGCANFKIDNSSKKHRELLNFNPPSKYSNRSSNIKIDGQIDSIRQWILTSNDRNLIDLMEKALSNNNSIAIARSNLQKSNILKTSSQADLLPKANVGLSATQLRKTNPIKQVTTSYKSNIGISWELDLFGKNLDSYRAKSYDLLATDLQLQYTKQVVLSQLLKSWLAANSAQLRLSEAKKNLQSLTQKKQIFELRYQGGSGSIDAIAQIDNEIVQAQTTIRNISFEEKNSIRTIQTLIGKYPDGQLEYTATIIKPRRNLKNSLPATLLQNRPDVLSNYIQLLTKKAELAAAVKNKWLPTLSFSAEGSFSASSFDQILRSPNSWNLGFQLIKNLFSNQEQQKFQLANEEEKQAMINYLAKVIEAYQEVENAIEDEIIAEKNQLASKRNLQITQNLFTITDNRYQSGLTDAENWIERLRARFSAQQQWLSSYEKWLIAQVNVLMALGGSYTLDSSSASQIVHNLNQDN